MSKSFTSVVFSLIFLFTVKIVFAENVVPCFEQSGRASQLAISGFIFNAKEVLVGQSISVFRATDDSLRGGAGMKYDLKPVIRTFSATHVIDELNGEKSTEEVTYRGNYWCRFDVFEAKEMCYGLIAARVGSDRELFEVEPIDRSRGIVCTVNLIGRVEDVNIPEGLLQQKETGGPKRGAPQR